MRNSVKCSSCEGCNARDNTHQNYEELEENFNTRENQGNYVIIFQQTSEVQIMIEKNWKIISYLIPLTAHKILFHLKILEDCKFLQRPFWH
jgi:hypothetical protein